MNIINWYIKKNTTCGVVTYILHGDVEFDPSQMDQSLLKKATKSSFYGKQWLFVDDEIRNYENGVILTRQHKYKILEANMDKFFLSRKTEFMSILTKIGKFVADQKAKRLLEKEHEQKTEKNNDGAILLPNMDGSTIYETQKPKSAKENSFI